MITLPVDLERFMQGQDLKGLKPYALLYRNKWNATSQKYELDTTPVDITPLIAKPNTLSMTLDVNEVAQYNANNVTLTLEDTKNRFVDGVPNSYFPEGYQVYGSKVVLYYGLNNPINPYPTQVGYTVVGSPTITDGVVSGFSNSNYLTLDTSTFDSNKSFEFVVKAKLNSFGKAVFGFNQPWTNTFRAAQNQIVWWLSSQTTGAAQLNVIHTVSLQTSTWYYFLFTYDGNSTYSIGVSTDGKNFEKTSYTRNYKMGVTSQIRLGSWTQNSYQFDGEIDLKETYVKLNGNYWFNGAHFFYPYNSTPLFTGVIKELPSHKPDKYEVDVKLVSPLEMLKDIEAKDFSDTVTGEVLTLDHTGDNNEEFYLTAQKGVGGITALYANGVKLYEGVDYEVSDLNKLNYNAVIEVKNSTVFGQTFTVDYYYWKRGLSIEEIVSGVVALGGYSGATTDIQPVAWQNAVRSPSTVSNVLGAIGYYESALNEYTFNWHNRYGNSWKNTQGTGGITNKLPANFDYSFTIEGGPTHLVTDDVGAICLGDSYNGTTISETLDPNYQAANLGPVGVTNGITCRLFYGMVTRIGSSRRYIGVTVHSITNGTPTLLYSYEIPSNSQTSDVRANFEIKRRGNTINVYYEGNSVATATYNGSLDYHYQYDRRSSDRYNHFLDNSWTFFDSSLNQHGANLTQPCIVTDTLDMTAGGSSWGAVEAELDQDAIYFLNAYFSTDAGATWSGAYSYNIDVNMARPERYMYYVLGVPDNQASFDIKDPSTYFYASTLVLNIVNLGNSTVLESLQDLALISGYEFGVDRQGVFFFRPRLSSTTPIYELDHSQLEKVDTVKRNLSDFFTKLTLSFAEVPLEFYANTGTRPTPIDKYGVINKDIDKPEIVNYDNPELAQAIGPQLLEVYSALPNIIQAVGKLNLALELGDIVNLKRNLNLIADPEGSDFSKYIRQQTYYRACKVTGMNYNFAKRQITYTLRDVTDSYPAPQPGDLYGFVYELPIRLGVK